MFVSKYHWDRLLDRIERLEDQVKELRYESEVSMPDTRELYGQQGFTDIKVNKALTLLFKKLGIKYNKQIVTEELVDDK